MSQGFVRKDKVGANVGELAHYFEVAIYPTREQRVESYIVFGMRMRVTPALALLRRQPCGRIGVSRHWSV